MIAITVLPKGKILTVPPGGTLLSALREGGIFIESPCGGAGTCGKCKVTVLSGNEANEAVRLACRVIADRDMVIKVEEKMLGALPQTPPGDVSPGPVYSVGVAVDIGTTTVEAVLVDMETGRELGRRSEINPQTKFGMDVLSRVSYAMARPEGTCEMQGAIVALLDAMTEDLCREARVSASSIEGVSAAGNCAMLHVLLGMNPAPLGSFPFTPAFVEARDFPASEIGLKSVRKDVRIYCPPSVSAFIGADVVAGLYASGLTRQEVEKKNILFIDIGTNGEIVLCSERGKRFVACSCAAGPALEGMNIRCGMRAAPGAIEDVEINFERAEETVRFKVIGNIGNGRPVGICGSGVLAAIRELLRAGLVRKDGSLLTKEELEELPRGTLAASLVLESGDPMGPAFRLSGELIVTQKDIRQVQLAKGALLSGVSALLKHAGLEAEDLDEVFVAGQFGMHLPAASLTECGILPSCLGEKIKYLGNTSKEGALKALLVPSARKEMEDLARAVAYMELGETPGYEELFMKCLEFP